MLCTASALLTCRFGFGATSTTNTFLPAKVVGQYALTSANDFPQRDPMDWRLKASNDGGKTWSILDERKGVLFSERHQRRFFKIPNRTAFNIYRLEIMRVRKPSEADSVQIAGLDLLGETEDDLDPTPIFADRITAQGDNPNLESMFNLFDGQADTKWLDFANQHPNTRASWIQWQYTDHAGLVISNIAQLTELRSHAAGHFAVRIEGVIVGPMETTNEWCLMDATSNTVFQSPSAQGRFSPGQRVLVRGVSRAMGQQAEIADVQVTPEGPSEFLNPTRITAGQPLPAQDEMQWVQASGKIDFVGRLDDGVSFALANDGSTIQIKVLHANPTENRLVPGMRVKVNGICEGVFNSQGQRVAGVVWASCLNAVDFLEPPMSKTPSANSMARDSRRRENTILTTIHQIRQLGPDDLNQKPTVSLRGVITDLYGTFVQDETGGAELIFPDQSYPAPTLGDYVAVQGVADWVDGDMAVRVESVKILGKGSLPPAQPSSWSELSSGHGVNQWVEIKGVVHSSDGSHVLLDCEGEQALATIRSAPAPLVDSLVDAVVRMQGIGTIARDEHQVRGITLIVPSLQYVEVDQAPADPFSLPAQEISSLLHGIGTKTLRRWVKIEGVLTVQDGNRYFLQDKTGSAMAVAKQNIVLSRSGHWVFWQSDQSQEATVDSQIQINSGDRVEVVGFPEMRGYSPVLTEALFRRIGRSDSVRPVRTDADGIFAGNLDSTLVSLEGVLLSTQIFGQKTVMEFRDGQKEFEAFVETPVKSIASGSRVRVTGVCRTEPTPYEDFGKSVNSFKILVGQEADLQVLQRPPWWDFRHTIMVAGSLTGILAIAACWIVLLRRQVGKRTILLQREIEERKRIELKMERTHQQLMTTSRFAGMAEVATYVLHNVGNVLNSVNLLGSSITQDIRNSMAGSVSKLADLLTSKGPDLGQFLTEDPRGQKVPGYLKRLAAQLAKEQSDINRKVELLTENIQHIKEIVATQHAYAKVSGVWENAVLEDIVEDALRMQGEILAHHNIMLVRDYDKTPPLFVDRHKVLQILLNLLQNAKHACEKGTVAEKQITVRVRARDNQHISVSVQDNGMGIAPENLTRIFAQGFSTRKDGHGLGLHSSVLMAEDMNGSLKAFSDGPQRGATFTLELPVTSKSAPSNSGEPLNSSAGASVITAENL